MGGVEEWERGGVEEWGGEGYGRGRRVGGVKEWEG